MHELYLNNKFHRLPAAFSRKNMSDTLHLATRELIPTIIARIAAVCHQSATSLTPGRCAVFMHPQERNIHGKMFGGYLMRQVCNMSNEQTQLSCCF